MNISFLEAPREVTFDWHVVQATKWVELDAGRELDSILVYAAVELRAAIERYIFEFLYLLKEGKLSGDEETRCRSITGIFALMKETDPFYRKTIEFTKLVISITPGLPEITVVDTAYLNRKWHDLSEYCHMQFRPEETFGSEGRKFQTQGFALLREVLQKFHEWKVESNCAILARSSLPDEVRDTYDKFIREEIDASQAKRMLVLMEPVLRARMRQSHQK
jgi:hypothetical protein